MNKIFLALITLPLLAACVGPLAGKRPFMPRGDYPFALPTQSYAEPGQCRGGSRLAAIETPTPDYPGRAWRNGVQGWTIIELDVGLDGATENVRVLKEAPAGWFSAASRKAVEGWRFLPPASGRLTDCLVRIDYRLGQVMIAG